MESPGSLNTIEGWGGGGGSVHTVVVEFPLSSQPEPVSNNCKTVLNRILTLQACILDPMYRCTGKSMLCLRPANLWL